MALIGVIGVMAAAANVVRRKSTSKAVYQWRLALVSAINGNANGSVSMCGV